MNAVTLGQWLKTRRQQLEFSIDDVSCETGINCRFLLALEEDDYSLMPSEQVYVRAFIRSYAEFLSLDSGEAILLYNAGNAILLSKPYN